MLDTEHRTLDAEHRTLDTEHRTHDAGHMTQNTEHIYRNLLPNVCLDAEHSRDMDLSVHFQGKNSGVTD